MKIVSTLVSVVASLAGPIVGLFGAKKKPPLTSSEVRDLNNLLKNRREEATKEWDDLWKTKGQ